MVAGCKLGRVHTTPKEFENGGLTRLKTHQMFSVHTTPEKCNNHRSFWICLESTLAERYDNQTPSFSKSFDFKMFSVHTKMKSWRFQNSFGLTSIFEKLRFRDGLQWTVDLTVEAKLRF